MRWIVSIRSLLCAVVVLNAGTACPFADDLAHHIEQDNVLFSSGSLNWAQSRAALIPGDPARVLIATQEIERVGSHG